MTNVTDKFLSMYLYNHTHHDFIILLYYTIYNASLLKYNFVI